MRKKKLLVLSIVLVIAQIVSMLAMISVSAADNRGRSYDIKYTDTTITLDGSGNETVWDNVDWSENFGEPVTLSSKVSETNPVQANFDAKFKAVWGNDETQNVLCMYVLLEVQDATIYGSTINNGAVSDHDYFWFYAWEGTNVYNSSAIKVDGDVVSNPQKNTGNSKGGPLTYSVVDKRASEGKYTVEMSFPIKNAKNEVYFDIMLHDGLPGASAKYSWNGTYYSAGTIVEFGTGKLFTAEDTYTSSFSKTNGYCYNLYQADGTMNINGIADNANEYWNNIPWSEEFNQVGIKGTQTQDFKTKFKAMWDPEGYLYLMMEINDSTTSTAQTGYVWTQDGFIFTISESGLGQGTVGDAGTTYRRTSTQSTISRDYGTKYAWFEYAINRDTAKGIVTIEAKYDFHNNSYAKAENTILFDIMSQDYIGDDTMSPASNSNYQQTCWNGKPGYTANNHGIQYGGKGYLSPIKASEAIISTEAGAGVRLNNPAGLRFETRINKVQYDALPEGAEITTGTLIIPSNYLDKYGINNSSFTKKNLDALGLDYLDIVNEGWANAATAEDDGYYKYYGSIVGIKYANLDRQFSGIGYMTVKTADGEYTVYGGYRAADHSRSVEYVAKAAISSGKYDSYIDTLQTFIKNPEPVALSETMFVTYTEDKGHIFVVKESLYNTAIL